MDRSFSRFGSILLSVLLALLATSLMATGADTRVTDVGVASAQRPGAGPALAAPVVPVLQGPVDDGTYIVGPGDRFSITVWGQGVASHLVTVSPEGELVIPSVATVPVAGKLLRDAKVAVARSLEFF